MVNPQGISQEKLPMRSEAAVVAVLQASPSFPTEEINCFSPQVQGSGNVNSLGNYGSFRFITGKVTFSNLQAQGSGNTSSLGNHGSFGFITGKITFFNLQAQGSGNTDSLGNHGSFGCLTGKIAFFGLQAQRVSSYGDRNEELARRSGDDLTLETLVELCAFQ